jgi:hypothetical protein
LVICPQIQSIMYTNYQHNQDATNEVMASIKDRQGEICKFFLLNLMEKALYYRRLRTSMISSRATTLSDWQKNVRMTALQLICKSKKNTCLSGCSINQ